MNKKDINALFAHVRRVWFYRLHPGRVCGKFAPNPRGSLPNVYCIACGYDKDIHRGK